MRRWAVVLVLMGLALLPRSAAAETTDAAYQGRAAQLLSILRQPGGETEYFSSLFLDAVPVAQWRALTAGLRAQHGRPLSLGAVTRTSATAGQVEIRYERATIGFSLVVAPDRRSLVVGLHVVGVSRFGDSLEAVLRDLEAMPGRTSFAAARLTDGGPEWLAQRSANVRMAVGSSFKLYVLAELARVISLGERHWSDVAPLHHKSFSGRLVTWPEDAPMTMHSLATMMIAESDNSATDTLMATLGRDKIDAMVQASGHLSADTSLPLLTTTEAFALKMPANAALARRYAHADMAERRALLTTNAETLTRDSVDVGSVAERPVAIDSIEWFASARDMVALLDAMRARGGEALAILAVNPGIAPADAKRWSYLGYKGGSEPGVMAMNFLAKAHDGRWYAVSGSWNNPAARLDEARFVAIMSRALNLLAQ